MGKGRIKQRVAKEIENQIYSEELMHVAITREEKYEKEWQRLWYEEEKRFINDLRKDEYDKQLDVDEEYGIFEAWDEYENSIMIYVRKSNG